MALSPYAAFILNQFIYIRYMSQNPETPVLRVPPHSEEAECGVLGSILLDSSRVLGICLEGALSDDSAFYMPANRIIYKSMVEMFNATKPIDMLTLVEYLRAKGELENAGGPEYLEKLLDKTPTAAHAEYYINIVRQNALKRRTLDVVRKIEENCYDGSFAADQVVAEAEKNVLGIADNKTVTSTSWRDSIFNTFSTIDRILSGGVSGVSTGFRNLDHKMRGLRPGEMIVLAARPSMGKTSLAMNICECLARGRDIFGRPLRGGLPEYGGKVPVGIFSLEMSQEALAMRMLCAKAKIPGWKLEGGQLNPKDANASFTKAASELSDAEFYVDDTGGLDVSEMRARARRMKKQHGIGLIMIDYLQLLNCREKASQGRQLETSAISGQIKSMAKELNVPVIVLSQLSRATEQRPGDKSGKPKLSDLRDSGAIEQDADVVLMLRRPCKYPGDKEAEDKTLAIVDVAKHRNGPTGEVRLNFEDQFTQFSDRDESQFADVGDIGEPPDSALE